MRKWLSGLMGLVFLCGMCGSVSFSFAQVTQQHGWQRQPGYQQVRWTPKPIAQPFRRRLVPGR